MTINPNCICTFGDLVEYAKEQIKSKCHNIGTSLPSTLPTLYRKGSVNMASKSVGVLYYGTSGNFKPAPSKPHREGYTAYTNVSSAGDSFLKAVTLETVEKDLNNFLKCRGLYSRKDTVLSFKSVINFFQNLSAFMEYRIVEVYSPYAGNTGIFFYNHGNSEANVDIETLELDETPEGKIALENAKNSINTLYKPAIIEPTTVEYSGEQGAYFEPIIDPTQPFDINTLEYKEPAIVDVPRKEFDREVEVNKNQIINSVNTYMNCLNSINSIHHVQVTVTINCCSCSSSSSSSSSSCSSSSSAFIVYMDI